MADTHDMHPSEMTPTELERYDAERDAAAECPECGNTRDPECPECGDDDSYDLDWSI